MQTKCKHILYAEDDYEDLELFSEAVTKITDMSLSSAKDGKEFLNSLNHLPVPNFILLDLYMPYHDGRSCIKAIRNLRRFDNVPIMVYSTILVDEMVQQCKLLGADYFVTKPANFAEILRLVYDISEGNYDEIQHQQKFMPLINCA